MQLFLKGINRGKYVFRTSNNETIFIKDIDTEKLIYLEESLNHIENNLSYKIQNFTIDGRKGVIDLLNNPAAELRGIKYKPLAKLFI